ncbi:MAG: MFS transporter, partial [Dehalococcoidia bacterium]
GASTAFLLALSAASGLGATPLAVAALGGASAIALAAFVWRERHAHSPLIDLSVVRPPAVSVGLVGAMGAYLVLFGPLTLFPQLFAGGEARGEAGTHVGLAISALPAGFAVAAVGGSRLLGAVGTRARALAGGALAAAALAALVTVDGGLGTVALWLGVLGIGLGVFIPANNAAIMGAIPARAAAVGGGLLNMGRGFGTALGVAIVALCLHAGSTPGGTHEAGARLALLSLLAVAVIAAVAGALPRSPEGTQASLDEL